MIILWLVFMQNKLSEINHTNIGWKTEIYKEFHI
jgi:hypothetical protein